MKNKKYIFIALLVMAIGFAAVSTTLYINGSSKLSANKDEFDVYYSNAYVNGTEDKTVIMDDKHIEFEVTMKSIGDEYELVYDITNGSYNYDADVSINCTGGNDYVIVTNTWINPTEIESTDTKSGKLTAKMVKSYTGDSILEEEIECTIVANAKERTTPGDGTPNPKFNKDTDNKFSGIVKMNDKGTITTVTSGNVVMFSEESKVATLSTDGSFSVSGLEDGRHEIYWMNEVDPTNLTKEQIKQQATGSATFITSTDKKEIILECINNKCPDGVSYSINDVKIISEEKEYDITTNLFQTIRKNSYGDSKYLVDFNYSSAHSNDNDLERPGVYRLEDEDIFYYRGSDNNYIVFAEKCWAIIRTTDTNGIKIIYLYDAKKNSDGSYTCLPTDLVTKGKSKVKYNEDNTNPINVGYTVNGKDSTVKKYVDNWFENNLLDYQSYLEDTTFCNEAYETTNSSLYKYNDTFVYYKPNERATLVTYNVKPSTICSNDSSKYTVANSKLKYPVALISSDEEALMGKTSCYNPDGTTKIESYKDTVVTEDVISVATNGLNIDLVISWTMTPYVYDNGATVGIAGDLPKSHVLFALVFDDVQNENYALPVVSLKPDTKIFLDGDGSKKNPYVVVQKDSNHEQHFNNMIKLSKGILNSSYDKAEIGDVVQIGSEKFYVIENDGTNIRLLSEYNLDVGNYNKYGTVKSYDYELTGMQSISAIGSYNNLNFDSYWYKGVIAYSSTDVANTNAYDVSNVKVYIDNYVEKLNKTYPNLNATGSTLTYDDLCTLLTDDGSEFAYSNFSTLADFKNRKWLYNTSYWLDHSYFGSSKVNVITSYGTLSTQRYNYYLQAGVRPVITVSASILNNI